MGGWTLMYWNLKKGQIDCVLELACTSPQELIVRFSGILWVGKYNNIKAKWYKPTVKLYYKDAYKILGAHHFLMLLNWIYYYLCLWDCIFNNYMLEMLYKCVYLFPTPHLVTSHWWFEINHGRSIYIVKISKYPVRSWFTALLVVLESNERGMVVHACNPWNA